MPLVSSAALLFIENNSSLSYYTAKKQNITMHLQTLDSSCVAASV